MEISLATERLTLGRLRETDGEKLIALLQDPAVTCTYMVPDLNTEEEKEALFKRLKAFTFDEKRFARGIFLDGRLIGMIHDVGMEAEEVELGWFVDPEFQGRGFASEALSAVIPELYADGFKVIKAGAFIENAASIRVMRKCGMRPTGEREMIDYRDKAHECVYYAAAKE